jgi:DNA-nicking Smr family endonuclease
MDDPIQMPIDGVLDLHTFSPREVKDLVLDYLEACRERGIVQMRIIHGKDIGNLKRTVHSILFKHPAVASFTLDHPQYGGWGATIVYLRKSEESRSLP